MHQCTKLDDDTDLDSFEAEELDKRITFMHDNCTNFFDSGDYDRFDLEKTHTVALHHVEKKNRLRTLSHRLVAIERARAGLYNKTRPTTTYIPVQPPLNEDIFLVGKFRRLGAQASQRCILLFSSALDTR